MEVAKLVPDDWVYGTSLTGSLEDCVRQMQAYKDAGAHEICCYGSIPGRERRTDRRLARTLTRGGASTIELKILRRRG